MSKLFITYASEKCKIQTLMTVPVTKYQENLASNEVNLAIKFKKTMKWITLQWLQCK